MADSQALCRDCGHDFPTPPVERRCPACDSPRIVEHPELENLSIAHLDCDAFYATVEKRDDPSLTDKPVVVGGEKRGVVAACCYIARRYGIRSAMPMRRALEHCPHAVVVKPNMAKYRDVDREVRALMNETTPRVEPISIDEAFLDLSGMRAVHGTFPARVLDSLVRRIEREIGITASIGLSYNKFLAKIASDLDKPRGFSIVGRADAVPFLTDQPVSLLWGVGPSLEARLNRDGIMRIGQLRETSERQLVARYGVIGSRLARFAIGQDSRTVDTSEVRRSISAETTFSTDIREEAALLERLWPLCERVGNQMKEKHLVAGSLTLKLKTASFQSITRSRKLARPTNYGADIFTVAKSLLAHEVGQRKFRLIGIGVKDLAPSEGAESADLFGATTDHAVENAVDKVRQRFGQDVIKKGRGFAP
ncbi:MAG: DNA polymerase IV [Alphaproteobacteria bacterium]